VKIWIDADAAPRDVKEIVFRAGKRLGIAVVVVANQRMALPANDPNVSAVWVKGGPDEADRHIADHATAEDVAVTADIPLAAMLVERGVAVLGPRGEVYSESNVRERLSIRDFMTSLRDTGVETGGPAPYGQREKQAFAAALDRTLTAKRPR
jgi:uncharacterized protein YaiI (UPF0178 family)